MRIDAKTFEIALRFGRAQSFAIREPNLSAVLRELDRALADLSALSLETREAIMLRLGFTLPSSTALAAMSPIECDELTLKMGIALNRLIYARLYYARRGEWPIFDGRPLPAHDLIGLLG